MWREAQRCSSSPWPTNNRDSVGSTLAAPEIEEEGENLRRPIMHDAVVSIESRLGCVLLATDEGEMLSPSFNVMCFKSFDDYRAHVRVRPSPFSAPLSCAELPLPPGYSGGRSTEAWWLRGVAQVRYIGRSGPSTSSRHIGFSACAVKIVRIIHWGARGMKGGE